MTASEGVTLAIAILGAALGLINTWHTVNQRRVRLGVRPAHAISLGGSGNYFSIEVTNFSTFPVTVTEVGFVLDTATARALKD